MTWQITINNPDGSVHATGSSPMAGPGAGQSVTIPSQKYSCDHHHTLTGTQTSLTAMGGTGVVPYPDPVKGADAYPGGTNPPSWDASGGGPDEKPPE